jgi:hypothetical protein
VIYCFYYTTALAGVILRKKKIRMQRWRFPTFIEIFGKDTFTSRFASSYATDFPRLLQPLYSSASLLIS